MNMVCECSTCGAVGTWDTATLKTKVTPDDTHRSDDRKGVAPR